MKNRALVSALLVALVSFSSPANAHNGVVHKSPKRGQFCPNAAVGHKHSNLVCSNDGTRARWK